MSLRRDSPPAGGLLRLRGMREQIEMYMGSTPR
jgi:hypothetical protein